MESPPPATFRSYAAPRDEGGVLCDPAWHLWPDVIDANQRKFNAFERSLLGVPLGTLRSIARQHLVRSAQHYSHQVLGQSLESKSDSSKLIVGGHQPELFHAGVWYKNALLAKCVEQLPVTAIHLQVDHDLCRYTAIKVPVREATGQWTTRSIPIEPLHQTLPWQMQFGHDIEAWEGFPDRVRAATADSIHYRTLLDATWPMVVDSVRQGLSVGEAFSKARFRWEREAWGWRNLEVPVSHLVPCAAFGIYWLDVVANLPKFHDVYHQARDAYRRHHRIRNQAHPVPALTREGDWWEAPFWVYENCSPERKALWCRLIGGRLQCTDRHAWKLEIDPRMNHEEWSEVWQRLDHPSLHIRPRALTMTLYSRWFLSDLFLHGIGGGKYDQMTDLIGSAWYGGLPPTYAVASATHRLPLYFQPVQTETIAQLKDRIWKVRHHPELDLSSIPLSESSEGQTLALEKQALLQAIPPRGQKLGWHRRMHEVNASLRALLPTSERELRDRLPEVESTARQWSIVQSREYAWCLQPVNFRFDA